MTRDAGVALVGLLLGLGVILLVPSHAAREGYAALTDIQSPGFFPLVLAGCLVVTGTVSLLAGLRPGRAAARDGDQRRVEMPLRLAATMGLLVAYYFGLIWLGMLPASMLLILTLGLVLGYRNLWLLAAVALTVPTGVHLLFRRLLYVLLPEGRLW
ncbi:MAG: tripartite tricarboxylate transporter TctB family protein [Pseudomonadota bacterium]